MTDDPYGDADLVALYDIDNPSGADHDYYRALATRLDARRVIDLGCGTGLLTRTLATPGREVVGVDPSRTMLEWAQHQPGAERVTWVLGDAASIAPTGDVDLVLSTGNAIMHLDDDDLRDALHRVRAALRPGGVIAFETRNPAARAWQDWTRDATYSERDTGIGWLQEWIDVTDVDGERVTFDAHNVLPTGEDRVYTSVLFFRGAHALRAAFHDAGLTDIEVDGGWHGEPVTDDSRLLVVRARKA